MELLNSLHAQLRNRGPTKQALMRNIHRALLDCLENTSERVGREDYQPGIVRLTQGFSFTSVIFTLRLKVSRNAVDIFSKKRPFPEMKIIRQYEGNYILVEGMTHEVLAQERHILYKNIPYMLLQFADGTYRESGAPHIQLSRIS